MINRREFFGITAGAGAAWALTPQLLRALQQQGPQLIQRAIPSTGEKLPVIGLSFSNHPACADRAALKEVLRTFAGSGGRLFDAMHSNASAEQFHADAAKELGIQDRLFWSMRGSLPGGPGGPPQPGPEGARKQIESTLQRINASKIDLVMVNPAMDPTHIGVLKEEKKAGRIRYIGVQHIADPGYPAVEAAMRNEPIDFIGIDYDIGNRAIVEDRILPLALERKIAVVAYFPFGNNLGASCSSGSNLFARVGNRQLPDWAAEFEAKTWAQFFLKYVISHPAITVARVGTSKASHMVDNVSGGAGRLPDEATRKRMAALIDSFPAITPPIPPAQLPGIVLPTAVLDRYVGAYKAASGFVATFRRDGDRLLVKPGANPEVPLNARSETRFQDPRGPIFEFQLDAQGKATGAILEQQGQQGTQKIPLQRQ